jgi:hypothetical protein
LPCSWPWSNAPCRWAGGGRIQEARHRHTESTSCITFTKGRERERERKCFLHHNSCCSKLSARNGLSLGLTDFDNFCTLCKKYIHSTLGLLAKSISSGAQYVSDPAQ